MKGWYRPCVNSYYLSQASWVSQLDQKNGILLSRCCAGSAVALTWMLMPQLNRTVASHLFSICIVHSSYSKVNCV